MACMSNNIMLERSGDKEEKEKKIETKETAEKTDSKSETKGATEKTESTEKAVSSDPPRTLDRQDSRSRWDSGWMFPRRWMLPSLRPGFGDSVRSLDLFRGRDSEEIRVKEDSEKLEISLDTAQYRPDELQVTVEGGTVQVQGRHEEKAEDGSKMVSRSFSRKWTLPQGASGEGVVSNLSSDGILVITATKSSPALEVKINQ